MFRLQFVHVEYLPARVTLVMHRKTFPGWHVRPRRLTDHELVYVTKSGGGFVVEGEDIPAQKGMLYYFSPGLENSGYIREGDELEFYFVHFDCEEVLPISHCFSMKHGEITKENFVRLLSCWNKKEPENVWQANILLQQLLFDVVRDSRLAGMNFKNAQRFEQLSAYVARHFREKISTRDLSALLGLSAVSVGAVVKEFTGMTVVEYLNHYRMRRAEDLLLATGSVSRTAKELGYDDVFYFSRVFKRVHKISPSEYLEKYKI